MPDTITYKKEVHIARVVLERPAAGEAGRELEDICRVINQDDDVYVVTISGAAAFGAGDGFEDGSVAAAAVAGIDKPVIAVIGGDAFGAGLELALACDIRLAADTSRFSLGQVAAGGIPQSGGTQRLPRIVGKGKALELILTGVMVSAAEAFEIGLVSRVVKPDELAAEAETLAQKIASQAPISLRYAKEAVNKGMDMTLEQGLRLEADLYLLLHTTADRTEGIRAFLEKRKPEFKNE